MSVIRDFFYLSDSWSRQYEKKGSKGNKKLCERCQKRKAVYYSKRSKKKNAKTRVRTGKYHTLCIRCYGQELDRRRGEQEAERGHDQKRKEEAKRIKESLMDTQFVRDEDKRSLKRARRRWNKSRALARDSQRRAKKS